MERFGRVGRSMLRPYHGVRAQSLEFCDVDRRQAFLFAVVVIALE